MVRNLSLWGPFFNLILGHARAHKTRFLSAVHSRGSRSPFPGKQSTSTQLTSFHPSPWPQAAPTEIAKTQSHQMFQRYGPHDSMYLPSVSCFRMFRNLSLALVLLLWVSPRLPSMFSSAALGGSTGEKRANLRHCHGVNFGIMLLGIGPKINPKQHNLV